MSAGFDVAVIGGASLDVLRYGSRTERAAGGAGLYTALAAACSGARAVMLGPYPEPMPSPLAAAAARIAWRGPRVAPDLLPRFEISHHGDGRASLDVAAWGAETSLSPADLCPEIVDAGIVHVAALSAVRRQIEFADAVRERGAARLSAGTYAEAVRSDAPGVRALFERADLVFLNANEARLLWGSLEAVSSRPGQVVFVTLGERGGLVVQGECRTPVAGRPAREVDPTGAGDTFCGATLAALARGDSPVLAARAGVALATEMVVGVGPERLVSGVPAPGVPGDPRCRVDAERLTRLADLLAARDDVAAFDFTGPGLPPAGDPGALDYFFAATLQQFGFWDLEEGQYARPYVASLSGEPLKGSDFLWAAFRAWQRRTPDVLAPGAQAGLGIEDFAQALAPDPGGAPLPALDLHAAAGRAYGRDMEALRWTPAGVVAAANAAPHPRRALLERLDHVGGYKEDALRKKAALLALVLEQRPERFLRPAAGEREWPVVDYHVMRTCLRTGLVSVEDGPLRERLVARREVPADAEAAVRWACFRAVSELAERSGRGMGAVDACFFGSRLRCPESTEPECARCLLDAACGHRKDLFQPVLRTAAY